ncbi:hypothetical protein AJ79_00698 [Helicocarpus griseus UAMH5409]|uniref:Uncharacterized protein n=1 Tax=Helicocarpus griseus UAMH5409 TaxID=1447875 RepID=A0A2B7YAI6_9EURO|nr:hypothetical protein AJ79_00698 [Helicocarpus griseus UAMH5409]
MTEERKSLRGRVQLVKEQVHGYPGPRTQDVEESRKAGRWLTEEDSWGEDEVKKTRLL